MTRRRDRDDDADPAVRELLARRAERARARPETAAEASVLPVAEFTLAGERHAIALDALAGVLPLRAVTPVPLSPPHVVGILRFEGRIMAALSLASLLGVKGWRQDPAVLLVVEAGGGHRAAFDCEQIPELTELPLAGVEAARAAERGPVAAVTTADLRRVGLIDVPRLLAAARGGRRGA